METKLAIMTSNMKRFINKNISELLTHDQWNIGIVYSPIHAFLDQGFKPRIYWLPGLKRNQFRADPFGINKDGKIYIFYEDFDYIKDQGCISYMRLNGDNVLSFSRTNLSQDFHMSYPYIFQSNGSIYCIPEAASRSEICLYKAVKFPEKWEKINIIYRFPASDATPFFYENRWWIAFSPLNQRDSLHIWFAPNLMGPWVPHAANPVKNDIKSSRPGGTPFLHEGKLYRPAQDCSEAYGGAIVINRITKLTPNEFLEEPVSVVRPDRDGPYPMGLHTLSSLGEITLVDGNRHVLRIAKMARVFYKKIFRHFVKKLNNGG
jgi:hypothetical protein